eukprot:6202994-Pleurochrysis_carterae.AAC.2
MPQSPRQHVWKHVLFVANHTLHISHDRRRNAHLQADCAIPVTHHLCMLAEIRPWIARIVIDEGIWQHALLIALRRASASLPPARTCLQLT